MDPKQENPEEFLDDIASLEEADDLENDDNAFALDELSEVIAERDEFRDRFMRAVADAENARKRADRDRREAENYGGSKLGRDMLSVFDNLQRAVETISPHRWARRLIRRCMKRCLRRRCRTQRLATLFR